MATQIPPVETERSELERLVEAANFSMPQRVADTSDSLNIVSSLKSTLDSPENFPPLNASVFPGDSIVVVLQSDLPMAKLLLESLIRYLLDCNIEPTDITVVVAARMAKTLGLDPESSTSGELEYPVEDAFHSVRFVIHDPADEQSVAYLAANAEGLPVMVSRAIFDADVVVPVGFPVASKGDASRVSALDHSIYPEFSNEETHQRHRAEGASRELDGEVRMVNDNLGVFSSIQVVPGPGGTIRKIIFGERIQVCSMAQSEYSEQWQVSNQAKVDLCVATIEDGNGEQTWDDFVKALLVADELSLGEGPIVIWSEIQQKPSKTIYKMCSTQFDENSDDDKKLSSHLRRASSVMQERGVFLRCRLNQPEVEKLGIGFVSQAADLARMIGDATSGLFLSDAHRCLAVSAEANNVE